MFTSSTQLVSKPCSKIFQTAYLASPRFMMLQLLRGCYFDILPSQTLTYRFTCMELYIYFAVLTPLRGIKYRFLTIINRLSKSKNFEFICLSYGCCLFYINKYCVLTFLILNVKESHQLFYQVYFVIIEVQYRSANKTR